MAVLLIAALLGGCAAPVIRDAKLDPIPHYALADAAPALTAIQARLANLKTINGEATLTLTNAKSDAVHLDAVYLLAPPDKARLRAWKLGTAVFDLTLRDGQAWAYLPREEAKPAAPQLQQSLGQWIALIGNGEGLLDGKAVVNGNALRVTRRQDGGQLTCTIDRPTLTPREYTFVDSHGVEHFKLTLSNYRPAADGQVWPWLIRAVSENGTIEIQTKTVEINGDLPPTAFRPPARAEAP